MSGSKKSNFAPPEPIWECLDCGHNIFAKTKKNPRGLAKHETAKHETAPNECPKCSSNNVINSHLTQCEDPGNINIDTVSSYEPDEEDDD